MLEKPTLIVICGLPAIGKSSLARKLSERLGVQHLDIDDNIRLPIFGKPHPHPEESEDLKRKDDVQMRKSYDLFFEVMRIYLENQWSLIVTATFSSKKFGQDRLSALVEQFPDVSMKVLWCKIDFDTEAVIKRRLASRKFGIDYFGATNTYERWQFLEGRYNPIELPNMQIDTSIHDPAECAKSAEIYIRS